MNLPVLPDGCLANPQDREVVASKIIESFQQNKASGALQQFEIDLLCKGEENPVPYILNSVLKKNNGQLRWQATLVRK